MKCQNCFIVFNLQILSFYSVSNTDGVIDVVKHIIKNELEKTRPMVQSEYIIA